MEQDRIREMELELARLDARRGELTRDLRLLREKGGSKPSQPLNTVDSNIELFLQLFRCRESVYPRLWENRAKSTRGYSPACDNEWVVGVCGKPPHGKVKCSECRNQAFPRLDDEAVKCHLNGQSVIGTYAIREDDTCIFIACDFDGPSWRDDALLYKTKAAEVGVEAMLERSRSGDGAHVWIFFDHPVPARMARALGTLFLAKCSETNHRLGLDSFDRFFPNQDYLPKGGFGNLIALPFQKAATRSGNTLFLDDSLEPLVNQWAALAAVRRVHLHEVRRILGTTLATHNGDPADDLSLATDSKILGCSLDVRDLLPSGFTTRIVIGAQLTIPLEGLPPKLVTALQRLATFANPEFFKLQRMRRATYPHPRFIFSGEKRSTELLLPRGLSTKAKACLERAGAKVDLADARNMGTEQDLQFAGQLTERQQTAVTDLLKSDSGVLVAPPGSGKTVIACAVLGHHKKSTLVLVHKQPLIDQWRNEIAASLGVDGKRIGILAGSKRKRTGFVDIAMLQSLARSQDCAEILSDYGLVVIDECHHVPASSFEAVMKHCTSRYILGLTATPRRKDSLEVLLYQQCGPIRHEIKTAEGYNHPKFVTIRETGFKMPEECGSSPPYHLIAQLLATDEARNKLIAEDVQAAAESGRFPVVLSDRKDQMRSLERLVGEASGTSLSTYCLEGLLSTKRRQQMLSDIGKARSEGRPVVLFATASLIGEGFNLPELDTIFLAMPISFEGRLVQYVGRLHRTAVGKSDVQVFDYVDSNSPVLLKMYRGRLKTFEKLGYLVRQPLSSSRSGQLELF